MTKRLIAVLMLVLLAIPAVAYAENTKSPYQLAFVDPLQIVSDDWDIYGMRNTLLMSVNRNVYGLDIGLGANITTESFKGVEFGAINYSKGEARGIRFGLYNQAVKGMKGIDIALVNNSDMSGIQLGVINFNSEPDGLAKASGLQISAVNYVEGHCKGVQIGLVNICKSMLGVQIGLANYIEENTVKLIPLVNAGFTFKD